jgi:hypothetical protein
VIAQFKNLLDVGVFVFETLKNVIGGFVQNFINRFKTLGKIIQAVFTDKGSISDIPNILKESAKESKQIFSGFTDELASDWKNLTDGIKKNGEDAISSITGRKKIEFIKEDVDASGVEQALSEAVTNGTANVVVTPGGSGRAQTETLDTGNLASGFTEVTNPLIAVAESMPDANIAIDEGFLLWQLSLLNFEEQSGQIIEGAAETFAVGFGNLVAGIVAGANPLKGFTKLILNTIGDLLQQLGKAAIQIGITMLGLKKAFASPLGAIAAGVAAVAFGAIIKSFVPEGFADGGIVGGSSFYGDKILARVNSGELILNTDQQKSIYDQLNTSGGGGGSSAVFLPDITLKGEDIRISLLRTEANLNRTT